MEELEGLGLKWISSTIEPHLLLTCPFYRQPTLASLREVSSHSMHDAKHKQEFGRCTSPLVPGKA